MKKTAFATIIAASLFAVNSWGQSSTTAIPNSTTIKVPTAKESKYSGGVNSWIINKAADHDQAELVNYMWLNLDYKLNDKQTLRLRPYVDGAMNAARFTGTMGDVALILKDKDRWQLGEMKFSNEIRYYMPVAKRSRVTEFATPAGTTNQDVTTHQFRWYLLGNQQLSKNWSLDTAVIANPYLNIGNRKYMNGKKGLRAFAEAKAFHKTFEKVSLYSGLGYYGVWKYAGPTYNTKESKWDKSSTNEDNFYYNLGFTAELGNLALDTYVEYERDSRGGDDFKIFSQDKTTYNMILSLSI